MSKLFKKMNIIVPLTFLVCLACGEQTEQQRLNLIYKNLLNSDEFDLDNLQQEYLKVCPSETNCTGNVTGDVNTFPYWCPSCSCRPDCHLNGECCPDVIYGYLTYECVSVLPLTPSGALQAPSYFMVSSCPGTLENFKNTVSPVTSLTTGVTYKNKQFAKCNEDNKTIVAWNATFKCLDKNYFSEAEVNTFEDLIEHMTHPDCELLYALTDENIPRPAPCGGPDFIQRKVFYRPSKLLETCNITGLWNKIDYNVDFACRKLNLKYEIYKNVFCFICNLGLAFEYHQSKPFIGKCDYYNSSGNNVVEKACLEGEMTPYFLPFKNVYCKLCNVPLLNIYSYSGEYDETWIHIENIKTSTIAKAVADLFSSSASTDNSSNIETKLSLDISYNKTYYACSIPVRTKSNIANCNDSDSVCFGNQICTSKNHPFYNCTGIFRNIIINRDKNLDTYNQTPVDEEFFFNYIIEMYFCGATEPENEFCNAFDENKICPPSEVSELNRQRPLSCLVCQEAISYDENTYVNLSSTYDILIKISSSNIIQEWMYIDVFSLLEATRNSCSITFVPSGVYNEEYSKLINNVNDCVDFPFIDQITCRNSDSAFHFGSYRKLFSLPGDDWKEVLDARPQLPADVTWCEELAGYAENRPNQTCREMLCSDGHVFVNKSCKAKYETYVNALYEITYSYVLSDSFGPDCGDKITISDICKSVQEMLRSNIGQETLLSFHNCTVFADIECSEDELAHVDVGSKFELHISVMIDFTTELTAVENVLLESLTNSINHNVDNAFRCSLLLTPSSKSMDANCRTDSIYANDMSVVLKTSRVNKLLTCAQIRLLPGEYKTDYTSGTLILTNVEREVEYFTLINGSVQICLEDFYVTLQVPIQVTSLQRYYKLVDNICTILSLFCLSITFITYCIFQSLRTIPGINNMSLTFSLFFAQLTLKLGIWQPVDSLLCPVFGILIHFFWLATFCSMNVCSFHMNRVFNAMTITQAVFTIKTKTQYLLYTYMLPCIIILLTVATHLAISKGHLFGYGKTTCFLTDTETVIAAFLFPCVCVFLTNILFFVKTILFIRKTQINTAVCRTEDRRNLFIYLRLWTLLGITWPLLIVDALSDISVFSYIALGFNTLQGVFIFISFVCNKRVLAMYNKLFWAGKASSSVRNSSDIEKKK